MSVLSGEGVTPLLEHFWPVRNPVPPEIGFRSLWMPTGTLTWRAGHISLLSIFRNPIGAGQDPDELREYYKCNKHKWHDYRKKKPGG